MKVRELQAKLSKLDPELDVICYSEDERFLDKKRCFIVFEVSEISITKAKRVRLEDRTPYLKLGDGPDSVKLATLEVTSDF